MLEVKNRKLYLLLVLLAFLGVACQNSGSSPSTTDAGLDAIFDVQPDNISDAALDLERDTSAPDGAAADVTIDRDRVGPMGSCPDDSVSTDGVGMRVFSGSNIGRGDDYRSGCGGVGGADVVHRWRAPMAGEFVIDTIGSTYDTLLEIRRGTTCPQEDGGAGDAGRVVYCNDSSGGSGTSLVVVTASAAEEFLIIVDGYSSRAAFGDYNVNISYARTD